MTELKPCPFCGGEAHLNHDWSSESGDWWIIDCLNDDCPMFSQRGAWDTVNVTTGWRKTEAEAIETWNTRHERTCEVTYGEYGSPCCGECGCVLYSTSGYCPNCGTRVKENTDAD